MWTWNQYGGNSEGTGLRWVGTPPIEVFPDSSTTTIIEVGGFGLASPILAPAGSGEILIACIPHLAAFELDGTPIWSREDIVPTTTPAADSEGRVYVVLPKRIVALDADGSTSWWGQYGDGEYTAASPVRLVDQDGIVRLFVTAMLKDAPLTRIREQFMIRAYDETGRILAEHFYGNLGEFGGIGFDPFEVVGDIFGKLVECVTDPPNCVGKFSGGGAGPARPAPLFPAVTVSSSRTPWTVVSTDWYGFHTYAFHPGSSTLEERWTTTDVGFVDQPVLASGHIVAIRDNREIVVRATSDGSPGANDGFRLSGPTYAPPTVVGSRLYVGTETSLVEFDYLDGTLLSDRETRPVDPGYAVEAVVASQDHVYTPRRLSLITHGGFPNGEEQWFSYVRSAQSPAVTADGSIVIMEQGTRDIWIVGS